MVRHVFIEVVIVVHVRTLRQHLQATVRQPCVRADLELLLCVYTCISCGSIFVRALMFLAVHVCILNLRNLSFISASRLPRPRVDVSKPRPKR